MNEICRFLNVIFHIWLKHKQETCLININRILEIIEQFLGFGAVWVIAKQLLEAQVTYCIIQQFNEVASKFSINWQYRFQACLNFFRCLSTP